MIGDVICHQFFNFAVDLNFLLIGMIIYSSMPTKSMQVEKPLRLITQRDAHFIFFTIQ